MSSSSKLSLSARSSTRFLIPHQPSSRVVVCSSCKSRALPCSRIMRLIYSFQRYSLRCSYGASRNSCTLFATTNRAAPIPRSNVPSIHRRFGIHSRGHAHRVRHTHYLFHHSLFPGSLAAVGGAILVSTFSFVTRSPSSQGYQYILPLRVRDDHCHAFLVQGAGCDIRLARPGPDCSWSRDAHPGALHRLLDPKAIHDRRAEVAHLYQCTSRSFFTLSSPC